MADTDFNALTATNTIAATDSIVIVRAGVPYRYTGPLFVVDGSANFGFGAAAPVSKIHANVVGSVKSYVTAGNSAGGAMIGVAADGTAEVNNYAGGAITFNNYNAGGAKTEYGRFSGTGDFGIGTTNPGGWRINARQGSTSLLALENTAGVGTTIRLADASYAGHIVHNAGAMIIQVAGTTEAFRCDTSGSIIPGADNARNLGSASRRFGTVYAATSTINTSDAALKTVRGGGEMTAEEIAWARAIRVLPYRFNDAIAAKGDAARLHFGVLAQDVHAAGLAAGIEDPFAYAFLCRDPLMEEVEVMEQVRVQKTEPYERDETTIVVEDGVARALVRTVNDMRPVFEEIPVVDEQGAAVMLRIGEDAEGAPIMRQAVHLEPVMVTIEQPVTKTVPVLDATGAPVERWGIRYEELAMFLLAASARQA